MIVSSDSDFTRLATRLRESGMTVYGLGARKTPRAFRDACDKFTFLEVLGADAPGPAALRDAEASVPARETESTPEPTRDVKGANLESMLTKAINKTATDDDWSALGSLGSHLNRTDPSFDSRTYGFAKLSDLVKEQPFLETRTVESSSGQGQLWVRLKGRGAAKKAAGKKAAPQNAPQSTPSTPQSTSPASAESAATAPRTPSRRKGAAAKAAEPAPELPEVSEPAPEPDPAPTSTPRRRTTRKVGQTSGGGV